MVVFHDCRNTVTVGIQICTYDGKIAISASFLPHGTRDLTGSICQFLPWIFQADDADGIFRCLFLFPGMRRWTEKIGFQMRQSSSCHKASFLRIVK